MFTAAEVGSETLLSKHFACMSTYFGLSLHQGTTESRKNSSSTSAPLIPTVLETASHSITFSLLSRCHVTTNSVAPSPLYKPHTIHNSSIRSDVGLTLETSAFRIPVQWSVYIINSVDKTELIVGELYKVLRTTPHRHSTTVSLETTPFIHYFVNLLHNSRNIDLKNERN